MNIQEAIKYRIQEISKEQNRAINEICLAGGLAPNTLYDSMRGETKLPNINTLYKFCIGANIKLKEFFDSNIFEIID